ncbi:MULTISPECIES: hypothetical protein [Acetobacter]|uniref:Uncharacterized protein n=1 Tax=Acetobacter persici TaxID=1076596 RepID=A0A6V8IE04_9PROT|nr:MULTISPECIES: hypothetical protein [Acetobacter]GFE94816.1 hypothetical protein DmAi_28750 [Acetobacter persici]
MPNVSLAPVLKALRDGARGFSDRNGPVTLSNGDRLETAMWLDALATELEAVAHFAGIDLTGLPVVIDVAATEVRA